MRVWWRVVWNVLQLSAVYESLWARHRMCECTSLGGGVWLWTECNTHDILTEGVT